LGVREHKPGFFPIIQCGYFPLLSLLNIGLTVTQMLNSIWSLCYLSTGSIPGNYVK
jgi:hypothetical protein